MTLTSAPAGSPSQSLSMRKYPSVPARFVISPDFVRTGTAYTKSAKDALDAAGIAAVRRWVKLEVGCPYSLFERMKTECLSLDGAVQNVDYGADVLLSLLLPENNAEAFSARVTELSAGACSALAVGEELMPVRIK